MPANECMFAIIVIITGVIISLQRPREVASGPGSHQGLGERNDEADDFTAGAFPLLL